MTEVQQAQNTPVPPQADTTEAAPPDLRITDLQNVVQIIDVAASRGAFRGPEMSSVGQVRDRIASFVAHIAPPPAENGSNAAGEAAAAPIDEGEEKARKRKKSQQ